MSRHTMQVVVGDALHEVEYEVTSEGSGPSGETFDGTADPGDPVEFYVVTVDDREAKLIDEPLMEKLEEYIAEHHETDNSEPDYDDNYF